MEDLREAVRRLSRQKSAGVDTASNAMLRRVFKDGQAFEVTTVLKPFVDMCLAGCICRDETLCRSCSLDDWR